jgi:hypothetical protein
MTFLRTIIGIPSSMDSPRIHEWAIPSRTNKDECNEGAFKVSGTSFIEYNSKLSIEIACGQGSNMVSPR